MNKPNINNFVIVKKGPVCSKKAKFYLKIDC